MEKINIKLSTIVLSVLLIFAIVAIIIMAIKVNKISNEKLEVEQQVNNLQIEKEQIEEKSNSLQGKIDTISNTLNNETANKKVDLNSEELSNIAEFLNKEDNNGFLFSNYTKIEEIELSPIFLTEKYMAKDERIDNEYMDTTGIGEITAGLYKVATAQIRDVLKEKAGKDISDIKSLKFEGFNYSSKYDAYYGLCSDYVYTLTSCTSGYKEGDIYVVNYKGEHDVDAGSPYFKGGTVTLKKINNTYLFISNEVEMLY